MKTTTKWLLMATTAVVLSAGILVAIPMYANRQQQTTTRVAGIPKCPITCKRCALYYDGNCSCVTIIPNPDNCSEFWMCDNGVPILMECPDGLYFCAETASCSWTWDPKCTFNCTAR